MASNADAAELLRLIADLLDLRGERFKPEAYRRAARSIDTLPEPLAKYAERGELRAIPGIGEAISAKLTEYLKTGRLGYLDRLQTEIPAGVVQIMRLPGIGPKTARRFWVEFHVESPAALRKAIDAGRLSGARGFGERRIAQFREAAGARPAGARIPIAEAWPRAQRLAASIRQHLTGGERAEVAGSLRRCRETVGDVDLLVGSRRSSEIFDRVANGSDVLEVLLSGDTKMTIVLEGGLQVDVRVVDPDSFGAALVYFTGSKDHNVRLRTLAKDLGLKINEYGVYRGERVIAGRSEYDVYDAVGLSWIPPEMREDRGEIDLAATDSVPTLVELADLKGDLHGRLSPDASPDDLDRALAEARRLRLDYVGILVHGTDDDGHRAALPAETWQRLAVRRERRRPGEAAVLLGGEFTSLASGDADREVDFRVLRAQGSPPVTADCLGPGWRLVSHLGPAPAEATERERWGAWLAFAAAHGLSVEVGPGPERLDSEGARELLRLRGTLHVVTGFDRTPEDPIGPISLGFARRAWARATDVQNTRRVTGGEASSPDRGDQDATMRSSARRARSATSGRTSITKRFS